MRLEEKGLVALVKGFKTDERIPMLTQEGFDFAVLYAGIDAVGYVDAHPTQFERNHPKSLIDIINSVPDHEAKNRILREVCKYRHQNRIYGARSLVAKDISKIAALAAFDIEKGPIETGAMKLGKTHTREVQKYINAHQKGINNTKRLLGLE